VGAEHTRAGRFRANAGGVIGAGIALGWCWSPLLRYANPLGLFATGLTLAVFIVEVWDRAVVEDRSKPVKPKSYFVLACLAVSGFLTGTEALYAAQGADRRCATIQAAMLGGKDDKSNGGANRSDPADVYQALGCRPQFGWW
jgi:hypothetical protein